MSIKTSKLRPILTASSICALKMKNDAINELSFGKTKKAKNSRPMADKLELASARLESWADELSSWVSELSLSVRGSSGLSYTCSRNRPFHFR